MSCAMKDVAAERERQISREGFSYTHDDQHNNNEMAIAAVCYADPDPKMSEHYLCPVHWPWNVHDWKPKDRRRNLVRAAALIIAEIERLDRDVSGTPQP